MCGPIDRTHAVELMNRDVDYQLRETVESALAFGRATLAGLGVPDEVAARTAEDVRKRDVARLVLQQAGALPDGSSWMRGAQGEIKPEPLTAPQRPARALSAETRDIIGSERRDAAQRALEAQDLESKDLESKDLESKDVESEDLESKDLESKDLESKDWKARTWKARTWKAAIWRPRTAHRMPEAPIKAGEEGLPGNRAPAAGAARFVEGSTLRHVVVMSGTGSIGLMAIFVVDLLSLLYVSKLGDPKLTAAVGFATIIQFFAISINIGLMIAAGALVSRAIGSGDHAGARRLATSGTIHGMIVAALLVVADARRSSIPCCG